uniref:lipocalin-like domain-containing protein n=1 Tax=Pedobacter schmidteae TaxID=2201271 RepID=UPI000EAE7D00|nr:lipocalin-like domain-containing protein [Pedobacter schmidteae]
MKFKMFSLLFSVTALMACTTENAGDNEKTIGLKGTWQLVSATNVENGVRTFTDYTKNQQMIKIINDTHFSFLRHDLKLNKEGKNNFDAGGGRYQLQGDQYTEFLDFYSDKNWEGKSFKFKVTVQNDTLIQTGVEKVEGAGVDRTITEKYVKVKDK